MDSGKELVIMAYRPPYRNGPLPIPGLQPPGSLLAKFDWKRLDNQSSVNTLHEHSLQRITHLGDGNCTFASIAMAVYGSEDAHPRVRVEICDFLEQVVCANYAHMHYQHQDALGFAFESLQQYLTPAEFRTLTTTYLQRMRTNRVNGGEVELACAAHLYRLQFIVFKKDNNVVSVLDADGRRVRRQVGWEQTALVPAIHNVLEHAVPLQFATLDAVPGVCAQVEPIMLLNEFSRSRIANEDPAGHYTLLKYTPTAAPPVPGRAAMGAGPAVAAAATPAGTAGNMVFGNNRELMENRRERDEQFAMLSALSAQMPSDSVRQRIMECTISLSRSEEAIAHCERLSSEHHSVARQWSHDRNNGAAGFLQPSARANTLANAAAGRVTTANARGTAAAAANAAALANAAAAAAETAAAAPAAIASAAQSNAILRADIARRTHSLQKLEEASPQRAEQIILSHVKCLRQRLHLCQQLTSIQINVLENVDSPEQQEAVRVLLAKIVVNDNAIIVHENQPANDAAQLAALRRSLAVKEAELRARQTAR